MKKIDFGLNWSGTLKEKFVEFLEEACKRQKLSFLWINEDNVRPVLKKLKTSQLAIRVLLDTEATYNKKGDIYAKICYAVKDCGGAVINDPDRTKTAIDKSVTHYELINAGIPVPYTVIVRNWEPKTFSLSEEELKLLKVPFIIKPALGYGQLGVVRDASGSIEEIALARNYDRGDNFLLQEKITSIKLSDKKAWFRVLNVFNTIIPCWWDDEQNLYSHVAYEEFNEFGLYPLVKIAAKIAHFSRMAWFSTEIAADTVDGKTRFIAIDYVNDQCDMSTKSETVNGVPDPVVRYTANHMVDAAHKFIYNDKMSKKYTIFLKDARVELRGLGSPPQLLVQDPQKQIISQRTFRHKVLNFFKPPDN